MLLGYRQAALTRPIWFPTLAMRRRETVGRVVGSMVDATKATASDRRLVTR